MTLRSKTLVAGAGLWLSFSLPAMAGVSPDQAARLGQDLTPVGAEKAGNEAGTIPAWEGGLTELPAGAKGTNADTKYANPFPDDKPLFTITAANYKQHEEHLSPGQIALLKKWPDTYKMPVYKSRRTTAKPQWVYDAIKDNAVDATLAADGEGIANATGGVPFPFPEATSDPAKAVIWNHKLRYRGQDISRENGQLVTAPGGNYRESTLREDIKFTYNQPDIAFDALNNVSIYFLQIVTAPPRSAGQILLVHETMNQVKETRRAWVYNPGQRRIRRAPNVSYDNPGTNSDGLRTNDQFDMFNGATDRYNWKLLGKKELYIPYNSYKLDRADDYDNIVGDRHANPDLMRYELHRVWVVEGKVREGTSHIYDRRVFYVDEDSWHISVADHYDKRGDLWRVMEGHTIASYDRLLQQPAMESSYDLFSDRYLLMSLDNEQEPIEYGKEFDTDYFNPRNVQRQSVK